LPDTLVRAELSGRGIAVFATETTDTAFEAEWRHLAGRIAAQALARALSGAALAAGFLSEDQVLSLQMKCEGKLGGLFVDVDARGHIRGYTDVKTLPTMDNGPSDLAYAIGSRGTLTVIVSTAKAVRVSGSVSLVLGDVATDLERYLATSEQRESIVELVEGYEEKIVRSAGILVQAQPGVDRAFFEATRERRADLRAALLATRDPEAAIAAAFPGEEAKIVDRRALRFRCRCSRERAEGVLSTLGADDLRAMIAQDRGALITCHFCNDQYSFDEAALERLLAAREA
jgi:molecular chaperone Hsp33